MHSMYNPHANTVHMSHQGLSGTSVGTHTTFLSRFQNPSGTGTMTILVKRSVRKLRMESWLWVAQRYAWEEKPPPF